MKLRMLHVSTVKQCDGLIELTIIVYGKVDREYTFILNDQYNVDKFVTFYRKGAYGRAINHLKKTSLKEIKR
jgi:hypothetical protein